MSSRTCVERPPLRGLFRSLWINAASAEESFGAWWRISGGSFCVRGSISLERYQASRSMSYPAARKGLEVTGKIRSGHARTRVKVLMNGSRVIRGPYVWCGLFQGSGGKKRPGHKPWPFCRMTDSIMAVPFVPMASLGSRYCLRSLDTHTRHVRTLLSLSRWF